MASYELADLLARKFGANAAHTALRIERGLRRYLLRRGGQLDFFHGQLRQAVMEQHGRRTEVDTAHADIATYFRYLADPEENRSWKGESPRPFRELCFHVVSARLWTELAATLESILFLEAKIAHRMVFDLPGDFSYAVGHLPADHSQHRILRLLQEAIQRDIHFIARHTKDYPQALFQCLWNSCWWYDCPEAGQYYESGRAVGAQEGRELSLLLEGWRSQRDAIHPGFVWMRSLRPPHMPLDSQHWLQLAGHQGPIWQCRFVKDGASLLTCSKDGSIRLWEGRTGECTCVSRGKPITSYDDPGIVRVAMCDKTEGIASFSSGAVLKFWNARSGEYIATTALQSSPTAVDFSPSGNYLLCGTADGLLLRIDAQSRIVNSQLRCCDDEIEHVQCIEKDSKVIVASDGNVFIIDASSMRVVRKVRLQAGGRLHESGEKAMPILKTSEGDNIAISKNGKTLLRRGADALPRLFDVETGNEERCLDRAGSQVLAVAISPDGKMAATSSFHGVHLWECSTGELIGTLRGHADMVGSLCFSPDGQRLATGSLDNTVRIWEVSSAKGASAAPELCPTERDIGAIAFEPRGECIALASNKPPYDVSLVKVDRGGVSLVFSGCESAVQSIAFASVKAVVAAGDGGAPGEVHLWDSQTGRHQAVFGPFFGVGHMHAISLSADGSRLAFASVVRNFVVVNLATGEKSSYDGHTDLVSSLCFSQDAKMVVSGSWDATAKIWRVDEYACVGCLDGWANDEFGMGLINIWGHKGFITEVAFSEDSERVVTVADAKGMDQSTRTWDARTKKRLLLSEGIGVAWEVAAGWSIRHHAFLLNGEIRVTTPGGRDVIAWIPAAAECLIRHPTRELWAFMESGVLQMAVLEGERGGRLQTVEFNYND
ncbi:MAG: WD40 repeat domain-containing protein [Verrucomicrobia bacterium]|nr:WD40 repeat domain-containing protein [Verrucomicrobiota bacterium]